ncbi:MAG: Coenzyme F420:L-glutamate ligase [Deltaproteobacteria bacterium ADurb.Bin510]|jgi:nitroreductase|nr:MAG: Coenzyme F420:L-glutamate ligase [Deltaproteobacteria bacterium ADurb.Bin510]
MDYQELLAKRRSIRQFEDRPVEPEVLAAILQDTTLAPTASNGQPCKFVVVNDRDLIKQLSDESKANILADVAADPSLRIAMYASALKNPDYNVFYNAPCLVIIVGPAAHEILDIDCSLTAAYLMFAATERGLGTCWINLGARIRKPELLERLGIPADCRIVAPIIIGYPASTPQASPRHAPEVLKVI